jgi:hypothetical protein
MVAALGAPTAFGGKPTFERIAIDEIGRQVHGFGIDGAPLP